MSADPTRPVIFLAFARFNIEGYDELRRLPEEARRLRQTFAPAEKAGLCEVIIRENVTLDDLLDVFQDPRRRSRIAVFHFSGHGDDYKLLLEDAERRPLDLDAGGLAAFLAAQPGLQLVFLNACSTLPQVEALHQAHIPAVVATADWIEDEEAFAFCVRFYGGLAAGLTLAECLDLAAAQLQMPGGVQEEPPWRLCCAQPDGDRWRLAQGPRMPSGAPVCPYPGMRPYTEEERSAFYGRRSEVQRAVDLLRRHPFLAIIGPSGTGKTSLLAAGIVPALQESHFFGSYTVLVKHVRPGADPLSSLTDNLRDEPAYQAQSRRLLLVVDPFEEVFAADASQRALFDESLLRIMAQPDTILVLAARADFYADLMASALWPSIREHRLEIGRLHGDDLRQAILQPAEEAGVYMDPGLVEQLVADAGDEPGALPFIQETLVMLWSRMQRRRIGLDAYRDIVGDKSGRSGLQVALAEHADHVYRDVLADNEERRVARRIFLRLTQFGEGRADTRRQQTVEELGHGLAPATFSAVLAALTNHRLTTISDRDRRVDLAHEALITGWPMLRQWIAERRSAEVTRRRLESRAAERQRLRVLREDGGLLDAAALVEAEEWVGGMDAAELGVSPLLRELVNDSRESLRRRQDEEETARQEELRRLEQIAQAERRRAEAEAQSAVDKAASNTRLRRLTLAASVIAAIALLSAIWAFQLNSVAEARRVEAEEQGQAAVAARATADSRRAEAVTAQATAEARRIEAETAQAEAEEQRQLAETAQQEAERDARRAQAENLAARALLRMQSDRIYDDLSLLLARDAVLTTWDSPDHYVTPSADAALRMAVGNASWIDTIQLPHVEDSASYLRDNPEHQTYAPVAYSPDGTLLAGVILEQAGSTGKQTFNVVLWDAQKRESKATLQGDSNPVTSLDFSPDGRKLVSATKGGKASIWDLERGAATVDFTPANAGLGEAAVYFSPDSRSIVYIGVTSGKVYGLDAETGNVLHTWSTGSRSYAHDVWFGPNGSMIAFAYDNTVYIHDWKTGDQIQILIFPTSDSPPVRIIDAVSFSPDGRQLLGATTVIYHVSYDSLGTLMAWDIETGKLSQNFGQLKFRPQALTYSPDGTLVASTGDGHSIELWDTQTGEHFRSLRGHTDEVTSIAFGPDGRTMASASLDDTIRIWNTALESSDVLTGHENFVMSARFSSDGTLLASTDRIGSVKIWNTDTSQLIRTYDRDVVLDSAFEPLVVGDVPVSNTPPVRYTSPAGDMLLDTNSAGQLQLIDSRTNTIIETWDINAGALQMVKFSPDGKLLGTVTYTGTVNIRDAYTGVLLRQWAEDSAGSVRVGFSRGEPLIAVAADGIVRLIDGNTGKILQKWEYPTDQIFAMMFGEDGAILVIAGDTRGVSMWSTNTGKLVMAKSLDSIRYGFAVSPNEKYVAYAPSDLSVREGHLWLWDTRTGKQLNEPAGHAGPILSFVFSPDSTLLASAGLDGRIDLWDTASGHRLRVLEGHTGAVNKVVFSPDGATLASASDDRTVRLWPVKMEDLVAMAEARVQRGNLALTAEERASFGLGE
jgi:WD40 repeat protein